MQGLKRPCLTLKTRHGAAQKLALPCSDRLEKGSFRAARSLFGGLHRRVSRLEPPAAATPRVVGRSLGCVDGADMPWPKPAGSGAQLARELRDRQAKASHRSQGMCVYNTCVYTCLSCSMYMSSLIDRPYRCEDYVALKLDIDLEISTLLHRPLQPLLY